MAANGIETVDEMEYPHPEYTFRTHLSLLWSYYYQHTGLESPNTAIDQLLMLTSAFKEEFRLICSEVQHNMLTFIELNLSWIAFMIRGCRNIGGITIETMNELHNNIYSVKENLIETNIYPKDKEQTQRIESHFKDIFEAVKYCIQLSQGHEALEIPVLQLPPFKSSQRRFQVDHERLLMTRLLSLYIISYRNEMSSTEILNEMVEIIESVPTNSLHFSCEAARDTVMRCIRSIFDEVLTQYDNGNGSELENIPERNALLLTYCRSINIAPSLGSDCFNHDLLRRYRLKYIEAGLYTIVLSLLQNVEVEDDEDDDEEEDGEGEEEEKSRPVLEPSPKQGSNPTSVWRKLGAAEPLVSFTEEIQNCSICLKEDITTLNFAILDKCKHLFCHDCIVQWFETKSSCPYCRAHIFTWTTRDFLLGDLEKNRQP